MAELKAEDKIDFFKEELELIKDNGIKEFTKICIMVAPDYFFIDCPASSSGKYHPLDELGHDGVLLHTKKVVKMAIELTRAFETSNVDEVISASIIHDLRKQGIDKSGMTLKNHPDLAAKLVEEIQEATNILSNKSFNIIRDCVGYHYGVWSIDPWKKHWSKFTAEELCVFLADYTVSRRFVKIDLED